MTWLLALSVLAMGLSCEGDSQSEGENLPVCSNGGTPVWIESIIEQIQANGYTGEIIRYRYKGEYVFMVTDCLNCADYMTIVYNCAKEVRCTFGGIAGFNTCPDFEQKATGRKVIWKN